MNILTQPEKSVLSRSRAKIKVLWSIIIALTIFNICLLMRMNSALDPKIISVTGDSGYNTVLVQKTDTVEYFNIPDSMMNRLINNVSLITRADTTED